MTRIIKEFEEQITPKLKWKKIEEIPDFPFSNFEKVKTKISKGEFQIGIDFTTSNKLAQWLYGKGHAFFFIALASTPFIVAFISIFLAIFLKNWWLLAGTLLGFLGQVMSNPYNPSKNFWKPIVGTLFLVFVWALWQGKTTAALLSAFFIFPFFINSFVYNMNQNKLREVSMDSEKIFIFLYQIGKLGLRNNNTGESYWHREAILEETKNYIKNKNK